MITFPCRLPRYGNSPAHQEQFPLPNDKRHPHVLCTKRSESFAHMPSVVTAAVWALLIRSRSTHQLPALFPSHHSFRVFALSLSVPGTPGTSASHRFNQERARYSTCDFAGIARGGLNRSIPQRTRCFSSATKYCGVAVTQCVGVAAFTNHGSSSLLVAVL
jgi:hypothetical protein